MREEMRAKDMEGKVVRERQEEERKVQEKTREARNREWRQKKEESKSSKERRGKRFVSSNEDAPSLEEVLVAELVCSNCKVDLWKGTLFQCNEGHLACDQCKPDGCDLCQAPVQGRNKALEKLREALLV